jgi:3-hydroxybutyrate dehydrogenase
MPALTTSNFRCQPSLEFVSPAQLGGTVAFLCSAAADQITGTAISIDGGWAAQ